MNQMHLTVSLTTVSFRVVCSFCLSVVDGVVASIVSSVGFGVTIRREVILMKFDVKTWVRSFESTFAPRITNVSRRQSVGKESEKIC